MDLAYAGTRGVHLLGTRNINQPAPAPGQVFPVSPAIGLLLTMEGRASSTYHSLQVKLNKRLSYGLQFLAAYTWSKSIDNSVGYWGANGTSTLPMDSFNYGKAERGLSIFDMRLSGPNVDHWFDKSAFLLPALFTYGNSGRDILISPGLVNFDWGVFKNFPITERTRLQFRGEFFNLLNHPNSGLPSRNVDIGAGGTITSLTTPPRQIQLALRVIF